MTEARPPLLEAYIRERLAQKPMLLMTHLVVGYPSLDDNWAMLSAMNEAGVDLVELQLPFSEPIADGPAFVKANHDAIERGIDWDAYFDLAARATAQFKFPITFMGYYNSVFRMGAERFCERLVESGITSFILPDLPLEESGELHAMARKFGLDPIFIMTPTNSLPRLEEIGQAASGFAYCAARKGVTGRQTDLSERVATFLDRCRTATSVPLGVGFGIRTAEDIRRLRGVADIAIVGTAGLEAWQQGGLVGYLDFLTQLSDATI